MFFNKKQNVKEDVHYTYLSNQLQLTAKIKMLLSGKIIQSCFENEKKDWWK